MRLIDADALEKSLEKLWNIHDDIDFANKDVWREIENAPTAEPERKKGKWIDTGWKTIYKCSECGNYLDLSGVNAGRGDANFCPNCGAEMRGK